MPRCHVELCGDPIGKLGFVCVVCNRAACNRHTGDSERELKCCQNCMRECVGCQQVKPANEGCYESNDFLCSVCIKGVAVIAVELTKLPIAHLPAYLVELGVLGRDVELHLPSVGIFEESNQVIA